MKILVGCEFSGVVRRAFRERGHEAWSCDLLPAEDNSPFHFQCDVRDVLDDDWQLAIFHPPCTYLANSGVKHLYIDGKKENGIDELRWKQMEEAAHFFRQLLNAPIPRIAVENPVMHGYGKALIGVSQTQTFQPWQFGHGEIKRTCLWLKHLPLLQPTHIVSGRDARVHRETPSPERWKNRSRTLEGIAEAFASQWSREVDADTQDLLPLERFLMAL